MILFTATLFVFLELCLAQDSGGSPYSPPYTCTTTTTHCQPGVSTGHPTISTSNTPAKPGKRGPVGPPGPKGAKGDPCQCDAEVEIEISQLRSEVAELRGKLENATKPLLPGWLRAPNGYLYLIHPEGISGGWTSAREFCKRRGGDIAMVGMRDANTARFLVTNFFDGFGSVNYWIGITDLAREGNWKWADDVPVTEGYSNWKPAEPSNSGGREHCGHLYGPYSFQWNDSICSNAFGVVCEKKE